MIPIFNRKFFPSACERFKSTFLYNSTKNISEFALWEIGGGGGGGQQVHKCIQKTRGHIFLPRTAL